MKLAVIADTHFGVRLESSLFHDDMERFFTEIFFPYLIKHNIKQIIHCGDLFDNRKKIDVYSAKRARKYFFAQLIKYDIEMDVVAGNHDLYFRERSDVSTLEELIDHYPNIRIYTAATDMRIGSTNVCYIPWINKTNRESTLKHIENTSAQIAFGHLAIVGYQLFAGQYAKEGDDPVTFEKFHHVYTGHFHHRHTRANITYVGSPTQHIWSDYMDTRGFHIFDADTMEMEFVPNPYKMFAYVNYEDNLVDAGYAKYVRVNYGKVKSQHDFDAAIKQLEKEGRLVQTIPLKDTANTGINMETMEINVEDTLSLIKSMVSEEKVYDRLASLYQKAQHEQR